MALNKRERNLLVVTVTVVFLGVNYFVAVPMTSYWSKTGETLNEKQKLWEADTRVVKDRPTWQGKYDDLGRNLKQSANFGSMSDVFKKMDEVASVSGVLMKSRNPAREEQHDVYHEFPVQCSFEAGTDSLVKFLNGLQNSSGFMTVEHLNVSARPDNSGILRCDVKIRALASKAGSL